MFLDERGQVTIFVVGMMLVCFSIAGIAFDGTRAFLYRRTLQSAADAAVLDAAMTLDTAAIYETGKVQLDPDAARASLIGSLRDRGIASSGSISISEDRVRVVLREELHTSFLGLVGIASIPVAVEAVSEPVSRQ